MQQFPNKRGRKSLFTSREVDEIQRAEGTLEEIALRYRASRATIARIRSYSYEYGAVDSADVARTHSVPGRKPRSRSSKLQEETLREIAADPRSQREVAEYWGVSIPYVAKLRAKYGTTNAPGHVVHPAIKAAILLAHDKSDEALAEKFNIPAVIVRRIRDGEEEQTGV